MAVGISEELEAQIIERLTNAEDANNIILDICEQTGLGWTDVQTMVERLQFENKDKIVVAQSPLLVLLALVIFLAGVGLVVYDLYQIHGLYQIYQSYVLSPENFAIPENFAEYLTLNGEGFIGTLVLGLAMIIGSLNGMTAVWESIFEWIGKLSK